MVIWNSKNNIKRYLSNHQVLVNGNCVPDSACDPALASHCTGCGGSMDSACSCGNLGQDATTFKCCVNKDTTSAECKDKPSYCKNGWVTDDNGECVPENCEGNWASGTCDCNANGQFTGYEWDSSKEDCVCTLGKDEQGNDKCAFVVKDGDDLKTLKTLGLEKEH